MTQNTPSYSQVPEEKKENFFSKSPEDISKAAGLKNLVNTIKRDDFFQQSKNNALKYINLDTLQHKGMHLLVIDVNILLFLLR